MKSLRSIPLTIVLTYCCGIRFLTAADGQESLTPLREIPPEVQGLIERACLDCHDQTLTEQSGPSTSGEIPGSVEPDSGTGLFRIHAT